MCVIINPDVSESVHTPFIYILEDKQAYFWQDVDI